MEMIEFFYIIGGIGLSVISYFLKRTMDELKEVKNIAYDTRTKLAVLESSYTIQINQLNERIEDLKETIKELTVELKTFNKVKNEK